MFNLDAKPFPSKITKNYNNIYKEKLLKYFIKREERRDD